MRYAYATITCPGCGFKMEVGYIGPCEERGEIPPMPPGSDLPKDCQKCGKPHLYKRDEMTVTLRSQPPSDA